MIRKAMTVLLTLSFPAGALAGCAKPAAEGLPAKEGNRIEITSPVTINVLGNASMTDEAFQMLITDPVSKQYPNITVQRVKGKLEDFLSSGEVPDLITDWNGAVPNYVNFDLVEDMAPLLKRHNFDLGRFHSVYLDAIRVNADKGELYAIPYYAQLNALFYNKDLFDKFGVAYPRDGMTWEETIELGKRMTRLDNGTQIQGLNYENLTRISFPWSPDIVDKKKERANVNNEMWKKIIDLAKTIDSIPGNSPNRTFAKGEVAMFATVGDQLASIKKAVEEQLFSVGVAQYPSYKELPNKYGMADAHYIFVTKGSKNKDAAMKVIETLTSDEVQLMASKLLAKQSPLKNPDIQKAYASEFLKGVDMQSIFKSQPSPGTAFSRYYLDARSLLDKQYTLVRDSGKDSNSALRDAEETINMLLDEKKAAEVKK
ncbi:ABC transporter substrate-binding protein [Paenibacillus allorhizosphaerae]|uniref:Extracellular solute-binding protein n=1 Tax=Paenibacillus allorhizosphaerae TaxID=2849866 RepID=A0ABN7TLP4_9BACL|nr:extracellular solute-binding protein [Paenibacillus allorhizosphaerae]CAG7637229.1 hypothetical protein PAECIP111802_02334 [Paenibacillus allorhizosphaerae]